MIKLSNFFDAQLDEIHGLAERRGRLRIEHACLDVSGDVGGESVALEVRYKYPFHTLSDYVRILMLDLIFFDCIPYY
jgi:hypothetical protein